MVKSSCDTWRLWLGLGLGSLGTVSAVLSIYSNFTLMFFAVSVLMGMLAFVELSLWSRLRRSWL
jgi:hypothetical protein